MDHKSTFVVSASQKMSKTVHILKFYHENQLFIERHRLRKEPTCCLLLAMGKTHKEHATKIVKEYNEKKGIVPGPDFHKGLTIPRLRILTALVAQKEGLKMNPSLSHKLTMIENPPQRFTDKFRGLLTEGIWMVGVVIEDSLSDDPQVNCGNPFAFESGDLAYWWAAVVIMDWLKYSKLSNCKKYAGCLEFYSDSSISRKHKYCQDSALSSLKKVPLQFLPGEDFDNFMKTIRTFGNAKNSGTTFTRTLRDILSRSVTSSYESLDVSF